MESARRFREKINSPEVVTGLLATNKFWPGLVDVVINTGLDYLTIDLEHLTHRAERKKTVEDHLIVLPRIESRAGLYQVDAIAAHPLTTAIAVGPYDLSADLGVCWKPDAPEMNRAAKNSATF